MGTKYLFGKADAEANLSLLASLAMLSVYTPKSQDHEVGDRYETLKGSSYRLSTSHFPDVTIWALFLH